MKKALLAVALTTLFGVTGCASTRAGAKADAERAGDKVEQGADNAGEKTQDAAETAGDKVEDATDPQ